MSEPGKQNTDPTAFVVGLKSLESQWRTQEMRNRTCLYFERSLWLLAGEVLDQTSTDSRQERADHGLDNGGGSRNEK